MSNSTTRELIALGVGEVADRVRRIFPSLLMNLRRTLAVNAGPRPGVWSVQTLTSTMVA